MKRDFRFRRIVLMWLVATALLFIPVSSLAQGTNIDAPDNRYSISDDVRLGREAAAQVEQQMPILPEGGNVNRYVERVGQRLVNGIPREFRHSQFDYEFDVVNARDINAFALPGGPLYVNRGTIEAAGSEGELAGVGCRAISGVKNVVNQINVNVAVLPVPDEPFEERAVRAEAASNGEQIGPSSDDARIYHAVRRQLVKHEATPKPAIFVDVENGNVTLRGTIFTTTARDEAVASARKVEGVNALRDPLVVNTSRP